MKKGRNKEKTKYLLATVEQVLGPNELGQESKMTSMKGARISSTQEYLAQMITKSIAKSMLGYQLATDVFMLWAVSRDQEVES